MSLNWVEVFVLYILMQKEQAFRPIGRTDLNIFLLRRHLRNHNRGLVGGQVVPNRNPAVPATPVTGNQHSHRARQLLETNIPAG